MRTDEQLRAEIGSLIAHNTTASGFTESLPSKLRACLIREVGQPDDIKYGTGATVYVFYGDLRIRFSDHHSRKRHLRPDFDLVLPAKTGKGGRRAVINAMLGIIIAVRESMRQRAKAWSMEA